MRVQLRAQFAVRKFSFKESMAYAKDKEAKVLLKNPVGYLGMFWFFVTHFSEIRRVRKQSQQMSKKWVYFGGRFHEHGGWRHQNAVWHCCNLMVVCIKISVR